MQLITVKTNGSAKATGPYMHLMVNKYHMDMAPYASCTLQEIFDMVKNIPYRPDPPGMEYLQRPWATLNMTGAGGDCDDKAIVIASWAKLNSLPYRFVAVRRFDKPVLHHVYCQIEVSPGNWVDVDPTYSFNTLGRKCEQYAEKVII